MSVKQDRAYARTAQDIERKYAIKKSFSEALSLINDNRDKVNSVESGLQDDISNLETTLKSDAASTVAEAKKELAASINGVLDRVANLSNELNTSIENVSNSVASVESGLQDEISALETSLQKNTQDTVAQAKNELTASIGVIEGDVAELSTELTALSDELSAAINGVASDVTELSSEMSALDNGVWTPSLNASAVSAYTTRQGWYGKIGKSVTVGFFIKATCKAGYNSTGISISGLPFTPLYSAAGGGMCSGGYVSAGFNFQCFVADASKSITIRVQSCNHTSQTNLSTSASGCWYPSSGGEITLSGTITFMTNS